MARRRFFVDEVRGGGAGLLGENARHLAQVLRAEPGQVYELSDNRAVYLAEVEAVRKDEVRFRILEELTAEEPPLRLTLFLALIKFDRFEWALEKATELGAEAIVPVKAARSEKGLDLGSCKRMERWRKIVRESSEQSRRARLPQIVAPVPLAQALSAAGYRYFLDENEGTALLKALPPERTPQDEVRLLVGPEGGWADAERDCARQAGWTPVWLGPSILRAETAAIATAAVLTAAWAESY